MSFGKNPEQLNRVVPYGGNLSQRARHLSQAKQQSRSSGGAAPYWVETFKVPTDHARFGRLIPGQYIQEVSFDGQTVEKIPYEYVMFKEHFMGGHVNRGGICSSGPLFSNRQLRQPCRGCDIFWEDVEVRKAKKAAGDKTKGPNRISTRDMFAFTWWDYGIWYHTPRRDGNGQPVLDQSNNPRFDWVMGQENDPRYHGCEMKYGHLIAWPMGDTYKETLLSANDYIMQDCSNCGGRGVIQFVSKNCGGCGSVVYDASTSMTPEQRTSIDNNPYQCQCGFNGFLTETINCAQCGNGRRASIFDVDLQITSVGSKGQQTFLQILNRSEPRPVQVQDPSVLAAIQPLDLIKKFSPTPINKQIEWWGSGQPTAPAPQTPQAPMGHQYPGMPAPGPQVPQPPAMQAVLAPQHTTTPVPTMMGFQPPTAAPVQMVPAPMPAPSFGGVQPAPGFQPALPGFPTPPRR